jgi:hypothetical protein
MKKTMNIVLLTGRSGPNSSHAPGDKVELPVREAITLVKSGQAKPVVKKEFEAALKHQEDEDLKKRQDELHKKSVLDQEKLLQELESLYRQIAAKLAQVEGDVWTDEEIEEFVGAQMKGEPVASNPGGGE